MKYSKSGDTSIQRRIHKYKMTNIQVEKGHFVCKFVRMGAHTPCAPSSYVNVEVDAMSTLHHSTDCTDLHSFPLWYSVVAKNFS